MNKLFVFDTNSLISSALLPASVSRQAFDKALVYGNFIVSDKTMEEFIEVLFRKKFDKYFLTDDERWVIINKVEANAKRLVPSEVITECRDPKDNKFLELAVAANAACLITGDKDLLVLHPFRGIPILNATNFLAHF